MNESRKEKFKRLANLRVNRILKDLHLLGNLSHKSHYEYSDEQIQKIFSSIDAQLRDEKVRFRKVKRRFEL